MNGSQNEKKSSTAWIILIALLIIIVMWVFIGFIPWWMQVGTNELRWKLDRAGEFGDSFGFVNSLFSALALGGVIVAIVLQMKELELQRKELRETKEIHRETMEAQKDSEKELSRQVELMMFTAHLEGLDAIQKYWKLVKEEDPGGVMAEYERRKSVIMQMCTTGVLQRRLEDLSPDFHQGISPVLSWITPMAFLTKLKNDFDNVSNMYTDFGATDDIISQLKTELHGVLSSFAKIPRAQCFRDSILSIEECIENCLNAENEIELSKTLHELEQTIQIVIAYSYKLMITTTYEVDPPPE